MPRRPLAVLALLTLALATATAACGGGASPSPSASAGGSPAASEAADSSAEPAASGGGVSGDLTPGTDLTACEIVSPEDVAAATESDEPVEPGTLEQSPTTLSPGQTECTYEGDAFGRILVELTPEDGANLYDAARGAYDDAVDISAVGDGAFNSDGNNRAFIWQDKVTVMLTMFLSGDLEQAAVAEALGRSIVAKL